MHIRKAEMSDIPELLILNEEFNGQGAATEESMRREIAKEDEFVGIACFGEVAAGFICGKVHSSICCEDLWGEITELYVKSEYRRQGVARELVSFMENLLAVAGAREIEMRVNAENIGAQRLYEECGYLDKGERTLWKPCIQVADAVAYKLKRPFDMSFLKEYGTVFKVFDDQDSGNICFGVKGEDRRYFVKFAGAPTQLYEGTAEDAISRLRATVPIYRNLRHDTLINFVWAEEIGMGYAVIFEWVDAHSMARMYPASRKKFIAMPMETKMQVFEDILEFHVHVAQRGYVAIDFYDGSVMYDFEREKTVICDIDFYAPSPYVNDMGRMWGSTLFMSPEEFEKGSVIDEITNVYAMGAMAFALFSDYDRSAEAWPLSKDLYKVVKKATSDKREQRQQSIKELMEQWRGVRS